MALICKTFTTWVEKEIKEPVEKWVDELQQQCQQFPWWDPRGWFCWLVVVSVKTTTWIMKTILAPITERICWVVAGAVFFGLSPFAAAIDSVSQAINAYSTLKKWLWTVSDIEFKEKLPTGLKGYFEYVFTCHCGNGQSSTISIISSNDDDAADKARKECAQECTYP